MKTENTIIPFTIFVLLVIFSFVPLIQISSLYLNGGLLYLIASSFGIEIQNLVFLNLIFSIAIMFGIWFANKTWSKIVLNVLSAFFLQSYFMLLYEHKTVSDAYYINFIILAVITSLPIFIVGLLKELKKPSPNSGFAQ